MNLITPHQDGARLDVTKTELLTIVNALNEVCNGLDIPEFSTRLGVEKEEALDLLKIAGDVLDQLGGEIA